MEERKIKTESKAEWEVQEGDNERRDCGNKERKKNIKKSYLARRVK